MTGRLITLEGGEGVGKSTLARSLAHGLGGDVTLTREPGGSPGADDIRRLIVEGAGERWDTLTETLLLYAARADHLRCTIAPALAAGKWVMCDRFTDSTRAYQVAAKGLPLSVLAQLNALVSAPTPDLTLILDLDPEVGLARAASRHGRETRFEALGHSFHETVRKAFLEIAGAEPARCVVLDASAPPEQVAAQALQAIRERLGP